MDPITASGVIGAGSALASGLLSFLGQKSSNKAYLQGINDTNATNLAIQRETNRQNLDMFNAQNSFNEKMWSKTNAYNSPSAVRARLIAAGVSPSALADANSAQVVQSAAGSPAQAAKMQAPNQTPSPLGSFSQSIGGVVNDFFQSMMQHEQLQSLRYDTHIKGIEADFAYQDRINKVRQQMNDIRSSDLSNREKETQLSYLGQQLEDLVIQRRQQMRLNDLESDNLIATGEKIRSETAQNYASIEKGLSEIAAMNESNRIALINATTQLNLSKASIDKMSQETEILNLERQFKNLTFNDQRQLSRLKVAADKLDYRQRAVLLFNLISDSDVRERMKNSWFRIGVNYVLGVDPQSLLQGAGSVAVGAALH